MSNETAFLSKILKKMTSLFSGDEIATRCSPQGAAYKTLQAGGGECNSVVCYGEDYDNGDELWDMVILRESIELILNR